MAAPEWITENKCFLDLTSDKLKAICMWAEARGEGVEGQIGVNSVIDRRAATGSSQFIDKDIARMATPVHGVILKKFQFSCFLLSDPNRTQMEIFAENWEKSLEANTALREIYALIQTDPRDNTGGALFYFNPKMVKKMPKELFGNVVLTATIGRHDFYKPA